MNGTRDRQATAALLGSICLLGTLLSGPSLLAQPPLRYQLEAGDQVVYERRVRVSPLVGEAAPQRYTEQLQLWCLAAEQHEAFLLADLIRVEDQRAGPTRGALLHVGPRGKRRIPDEFLPRIAGLDPLFELIPILPPALEPGPTWLTDPDHFGRRWRCTRVAESASAAASVRVDFALADPTGVAEILGQTQRGSYWFDPRSGIVVRVESEWSDRSADRRVQAMTRLHTRLKHESHWCRQRVEEAHRLLRTLRLEDRLLDQLAAEPERVEWILEHGERLWSELVLQIPGEQKSPLRRLARGQRALLAERAETYRERAELAGQWLGSSSAHWSLQTPEGETVRSEDLRDRFVVECFWRADSLWSLRSLATLRRLQEQLPADAFRIVCLNLDADVTAGRRAAEQCGGGLTHVLSGPPVGGKPPRELPVWRILDDRSTVVRVYFGWQPTLAGKILSLRR